MKKAIQICQKNQGRLLVKFMEMAEFYREHHQVSIS